jgi:hypothetical protein
VRKATDALWLTGSKRPARLIPQTGAQHFRQLNRDKRLLRRSKIVAKALWAPDLMRETAASEWNAALPESTDRPSIDHSASLSDAVAFGGARVRGRNLENGASEGIRTLDTHVGNVMLYQAELRSLPNKPGQITGICVERKQCFSAI